MLMVRGGRAKIRGKLAQKIPEISAESKALSKDLEEARIKLRRVQRSRYAYMHGGRIGEDDHLQLFSHIGNSSSETVRS